MLSAFNYAQGIVEGVEFTAKFHSGNFQAYANLALGFEKATDVVSNQYLFDNTVPLPDLGGETLRQYVNTHWIYTDHTQIATGSAGAAYLFCGRPAYAAESFNAAELSWCGTRLSGDMIYGSGLRTGDANIGTLPPYAQFNGGIARQFLTPNDPVLNDPYNTPTIKQLSGFDQPQVLVISFSYTTPKAEGLFGDKPLGHAASWLARDWVIEIGRAHV